MSEKNFSIPENAAVVTSTYVVKENMPVLYVSHQYDDEEGEIWQFHCGNGDYDMNKMLLVSLDQILDVDSSLTELSDLPVNFKATRRFIGDKWVYSAE